MRLYLWIVLVPVGWYLYSTSDSQNTLVLVGLVLATVVVAFAVRSGIRAAAAANNVVAAAATFKMLNHSDQQRVHEHTVEIIRRSGWQGQGEPSFRDDAVRFGWYALSMAELGIKSVCISSRWQFVQNPFVAVSVDSSYVNAALQRAKKQGFDVQLSGEAS
ncbi:MAG TPA: hypothetical protein PLJ86_18270 [Candidatus Thiothrix moscowensis]|nr:hypothetical protein [Candidatus Thiothrix moscowensis]